MLPAAASIKKQGANKGATTAFLISTPESGVDSIAVSYALLDPVLTIVRPVAAFVTAICAGILENTLFWEKDQGEVVIDRSCPVDGCCDGNDCPDEVHRRHHTIIEKITFGIRYGFKEVWGDIVAWFFVGLLLAAVITALIPEDVMASLLGGGLSSMLVMLVVGIPLYICATASTPVAAALIMKGVSPGAALVFLLVGPATNITSLSVLIKLLGKKSTALYLVVLGSSAVLFGLGVDALYQALGISPRAIIGEASELVPETLKLLASFVLLGLSISPLYGQIKAQFVRKAEQTVFFSDFPILPQKVHVHLPHDKQEKKSNCSCCD